jgi:putative flavoprotein involved in K+ transport
MQESTVTDLEPSRQLNDWLFSFETALNARDIASVTALFAADDCYWRDLVALTWNIATMEGRAEIAAMLRAQLDAALPIEIVPDGAASVTAGRVEGWFDFETANGRGKGHVRLRDGRCWTLMTSMSELKGFEEPAGRRRDIGIVHEARKGRPTWLDERQREERTLGHEVQPYCLIVGGGQCGLALGARLKRLGVPTLILDALETPGDSWRRRYKTLYLHDAVWADHLPYLPFPDHWPVYMSKDKMGDWLEIYARAMELNVWGSTTCERASYDPVTQSWRVEVNRAGQAITLHPKQLVLATGLSGLPQTPSIPGAGGFKGIQYHSSEHADGAALAGKKCVVIGANNSAHDICADLWAHDADVTMIQRSPTTVMKATALRRLGDKGPFSEAAREAGITTERADLMVASMPYRPKEAVDRANCEKVQAEDAEFYARLKASGFMFDFGEDNTGISAKYVRRASGYYIDVGASDLIADGRIKVRSRVGVAEIRPHAVVLTDGTELPADAIIYATGFGPMEGWAEMLISKEVADRVGRCWGLGSGTALDPGPWEGELRNMWKPTAQDALWLHGGNLAQSRLYSLHLALQLKARMEGLATPVYQPPPIVRETLG